MSRAKEVTVVDEVVYEDAASVADFTDGESTSGTYVCKFELPVGFWAKQTVLTNVTGFAGDTSAVAIVGDGSDADRFNTGTLNVFANATVIDGGAVSGTKAVTTAVKPTITVTSATDFTDVVTNGNGKLTIRIYGRMVL